MVNLIMEMSKTLVFTTVVSLHTYLVHKKLVYILVPIKCTRYPLLELVERNKDPAPVHEYPVRVHIVMYLCSREE